MHFSLLAVLIVVISYCIYVQSDKRGTIVMMMHDAFDKPFGKKTFEGWKQGFKIVTTNSKTSNQMPCRQRKLSSEKQTLFL